MKSTIVSLAAIALFASSAVGTLATDARPAPMASCASKGQLKSLNALHPTAIRFVNSTKQIRVVYWLNYSGKRTVYKILAPGKTYAVSRTYLTHPWLIANSTGECLNVYMPVAGGSRVTL
jgi:hypothetical protein